jgi:T5orf172 domain
VKKALNSLKSSGVAENPLLGFWRIKPGQHQLEEVSPPDPIPDEIEQHPQAERTIGTGDSSVYFYYYPTYRRDAENRGSEIWPCKIGRSERDPINRVYAQASTALPEAPIIGLLLRTSFPSQWEHAIHYILALRGRIVEDAPGEEWFNTSINEVVEIIRYIDPKLDDVITGESNLLGVA